MSTALLSRFGLVEFEVEILERRERAVLVRLLSSRRETWLSLTQVEITPAQDGRAATVQMPDWLAVEKDIA